MSEGSPANPSSAGQSQSNTASPNEASGGGNVKAIAMPIIGLGIGLVAGAFLAPFAENFFGVNNGIEPVKASGTPVKDERNTQLTPETVPAAAASPAPVPDATPVATPATIPATTPAPAPKN